MTDEFKQVNGMEQNLDDGENLVDMGKKKFEETISSKVSDEDGMEETHISYNPCLSNPMFFGNIGKRHGEIDWTK